MADLRIVVGRLAGPGDPVRRRRPRRVALDREAHVPGRLDDRRPALRPVSGQVFRHPRDAGELSVLAVLFHAEAEALLEVPGQGVAVEGAGRLHPGIDRMLVQRPVPAVGMGPGGIEDDAMGMQLGIVVPARAVLEHRARDIGRQHLDLALPVADPGIAAMAQHRLFQGHPRGLVVRPLDLRPQFGIGDRPQGGDALVGAEGQVEAGRAPVAAGIPGQPAAAVRGEAAVEPMEIAAVDRAAVGQSEQAHRVEPDAVRLLAGGVVFVGMPERALALQVIGRRGRLGQGRYHGGRRQTGDRMLPIRPS